MVLLKELTILFNKKIVLIFLLTLAVFTSTGTLAYWSNEVQGTQRTSTTSFQIGSALPSGTLTFTDTINPSGYDLPVSSMIRSNTTETISFNLSWTTGESQTSGWGGSSTVTSAIVDISYTMTALVSGSPANDTQIQKIMAALIVTADSNNVYDLDLNSNQTTYFYTISFDTNMDRDVYNLLRRTEVTLQFDYIVTTN